MPLYFFNVHNDDVTMDPEGQELADDEAAHARGIKEARQLAAETVGNGHLTRHHRIEVTDTDRKVIHVIHFDEAVEIRD